MAAKSDLEREWRKALDAHAAATLATVIDRGAGTEWAGQVTTARPGPLVDGRPSVEIQGIDGEWRRYLLRLTEAPVHAPLDPAMLQAMRS